MRDKLDYRRKQLDLQLGALDRVLAVRASGNLGEAERGGLIHFFCLASELGWKVLLDWLIDEGVDLPYVAPNTVVRAAHSAEIIDDGDGWSAMMKSRNMLTHVYDEASVEAEIEKIVEIYRPLLAKMMVKLS